MREELNHDLLPVSAPAKQIPCTSGYPHGHIKWRVVSTSSILDRRQNIIRKLAFYSDFVSLTNADSSLIYQGWVDRPDLTKT